MLQLTLKKFEKIAVICSPRLGDALMAMVTVNNLLRNGYKVDVYGNYIYVLREWFSWVNIFPEIQLGEQRILEKYPVVLHMYDNEFSRAVASWHPNSVILSFSPLYKARMSMVDIQTKVCAEELGLADVVRNNNMQPLAGLISHKYPQRIVIHPTSSLARKNWPKYKFIKLAKKLTQLNYEVCFILAPNERADWLDVENNNCGILVPQFASLSDVAAFIYESAFFIGNDSGIGHLASNLGVPTVSIILRKGVARQWQPTWADGEVVLSPAWLNPRPIKEKLWKYFISVNMVLKKFKILRERCQQKSAEHGDKF